MHAVVLGALDEAGRPAVAAEQAFELLARDARQDRGVVDLVPVQVEDRQDRPVAHRVQELVDVPGRRQRTGFRFAVADRGRDDEVRVVERRSAGVGQHVAQLAPFVDRSGGFRRAVAPDAAREGELFEELSEPVLILPDVGKDLRVRPLEIDGREHARSAVARPAMKIMSRSCFLICRIRWMYMKARPGLAPQWPRSRFLMCSGRSGSRSKGLACR
jgi:hypothetical protein